jgi:oligoribonuclease
LQPRFEAERMYIVAKKHKDNMVWMDLEMTGLDPEKEGIIEIATIITDGELNILAEGPNLVVHQSSRLLKGMDEWNQNQHEKSGLIEKVKASEISDADAEKQTLEFIQEYCLEGKAPLCGNSIHHDRRFVIKYMPILNAYLSYRNVDVTTIKVLVDRWYPKNLNKPRKKENHRALDDIRESIEELKYYRKGYFKKLRPRPLEKTTEIEKIEKIEKKDKKDK